MLAQEWSPLLAALQWDTGSGPNRPLGIPVVVSRRQSAENDHFQLRLFVRISPKLQQ